MSYTGAPRNKTPRVVRRNRSSRREEAHFSNAECGVRNAELSQSLTSAATKFIVHGERFLSLLRTHWDHEPLRLTEARSGPRVCDPQPARFMGRGHLQNSDVNRSHEPDRHPSPCPLPAKRGEGGRRPGEGRFMESTVNRPPPALPAGESQRRLCQNRRAIPSQSSSSVREHF